MAATWRLSPPGQVQGPRLPRRPCRRAMMAPMRDFHDASSRLWYDHPRMIEDLLRGFVPADLVEAFDFDSLEQLPTQHVGDDRRQSRGDMLWRLRFRDGVERVTRTARERRLALMCAEREPLVCHRAILVARALAEAGLDVAHILADGGLEPHADAIDRLRERLGLAQRDLFDTDAELVGKAYAIQGARIAHATDQGADGEPAGRP